MKRRAAFALSLFFVVVSGEANASSDHARAREAYDRGLEAHKRGDFSKAANEFADADAFAPSDVALQAGLDAAIDADDPVVGAELLERTKRGPMSGGLAQSVEIAKQKLGGRAGRVHLRCPAASKCSASIDGTPIDAKKGAWTRAGQHTVLLTVDGASQSKIVDVRPDQTTEVLGPTSDGEPISEGDARIASDDTSSKKNLPPAVFFVGLGATVVAGVAATYFMLATKSKHDDFTSAGCDAAPRSGCNALKEDGESTQTNANVALGVTALFAVATIVIGAAFTDWRSEHGKSARRSMPVLAPVAGGGAFGGAVVRF